MSPYLLTSQYKAAADSGRITRIMVALAFRPASSSVCIQSVTDLKIYREKTDFSKVMGFASNDVIGFGNPCLDRSVERFSFGRIDTRTHAWRLIDYFQSIHMNRTYLPRSSIALFRPLMRRLRTPMSHVAKSTTVQDGRSAALKRIFFMISHCPGL